MWQGASGVQFCAVQFRKELANQSCDEKGLRVQHGRKKMGAHIHPHDRICPVEGGTELFRVGPGKAREDNGFKLGGGRFHCFTAGAVP